MVHSVLMALDMVLGVAKRLRVHSVRVCDVFKGNGCPITNVVAGLEWVYYNHVDPAAVLISINYNTHEEALFSYQWADLYTFVTGLIDAGVTVVISAGNHPTDPIPACDAPPAHITEAIVVAASTRFDTHASFSNFGSCVDLFAPGDDVVVATYFAGFGGGLESSTFQTDGTSFSAPLVAGLAAMCLLTNPTSSPAQVEAFILNWASTGKISNPTPGTPNKLLVSPFGNDLNETCPE